MDVIWDQDVRTALSAIIGREPPADKENGSVEQVTRHVQLAVRYANELNKTRGDLEKRGSGRPEVIHSRPQRFGNGHHHR